MDGSPKRFTVTNPQLGVLFTFDFGSLTCTGDAPLVLEKNEFFRGQASRKHSPRSEMNAVILDEKLNSIERV